ncbi:TRASH domain-containing protein [Escherichia sp. WS1667]
MHPTRFKGYETCCPECNHEFKTDFVY